MMEVVDTRSRQAPTDSLGPRDETPADEQTSQIRRMLEGVIGVPATEGNHIEVLRNGDEIFPAMLEAIDAAEHTIDFLTFVYWQGEIGETFAEKLTAKAAAGVRVRVLLDAWGAFPMDKSLIESMEAAGVRVHWFRPLHRFRPGQMNHRTHRKVLIVDEDVAFTGGVGIADEWQGDARDEHEWRDTHFRIHGPAVDGLRSAFLDNWAETDHVLYEEGVDRFPDQPQPGSSVVQCVRGASETGWSDVATLFRALLQAAQERIRITTAYFVPDEELTDRLCEAADRGVKVQILLPGPHADKRFVQIAGEAMYDRLLECGVEIWNFQPSMLHTKVMTIDGVVANVGSANLNARSTACDEEINVVVLDSDVVRTLDAHFDDDLERSVAIEPGRWEDRSLTQRAVEKVVTPIRRLM
jgi:cardiolipin synthase